MKNKHFETVAGGGLLHRRLFLSSSVGAAGLAWLRAQPAAAAQQDVPSWMKSPGQGLRPYGERSPYESAVQRIVARSPARPAPDLPVRRSSISRASSHRVRCTSSGITAVCPTFPPRASAPDSRAGGSAVDVRPGVAVTLSARLAHSLHRVFRQQRRPLRSRAAARRCRRVARSPVVQRLDGRAVVDAARRGRRAAGGKWFLAEGADAAAMSRSIPIEKAWDDALIAIYQNGEHLRPENGIRCGSCSRLGRQHEREVAAPAEGDCRAGNDERRDIEVHRNSCPTARPGSLRFRWA